MAATAPAGDFDYDRGGTGYARVRRTDPRIAARIHAALGDARTVLNVGAGAGSYEPEDRRVVAVEPSAAMRAQRPPHLAPAIRGRADDLPFDDGAFDGAMAIYTVHQWPDLARGLAELRRVTRGPVVVMSSDGDALERFWLNAYAPEVIAAERRRYPPLATIAEALGGEAEVQVVPIPLDCQDGFSEAFYGRPDAFLDSAVRQAQSAWGFVDAHVPGRMAARLSEDLRSGAWDARWGALRSQAAYLGSLHLVVSRPG